MASDENNLDLPERLKDELRGMYAPLGPFPANRDAGILRRAMRGRQRRQIPRWAMSGAVAAAVAIAAGSIVWWNANSSRHSSDARYVRTGDVRDAFYLARELKHGRNLANSWDANGDGHIDDGDVKVVALAAVRIGEGGLR